MISMENLSADERRFLIQIDAIAGCVAFNPRDDEVIASLLDQGLVMPSGLTMKPPFYG